MNNIEVYANTLIDQLIRIKDRHRDIFMADEVNAINNICNLVSHNIHNLEKK